MILPRKNVLEIASDLYQYGNLFATLMENSQINIVDEGERAWVEFDKEGRLMRFCFNKEFWETSSEIQRLFVISHEVLHIFLRHGIRSSRREEDAELKNVAMDVVVNEMLFNNYGFRPSDVPDIINSLALVDSVSRLFNLSPKEIDNMRGNLSFENVLDILAKKTLRPKNPFNLDEHGDGDETKEIDDQYKEMVIGSSVDIKDAVNKISSFTSSFKGEHVFAKTCFNASGVLWKTNRKWETIIFSTLHKMIDWDFIEEEKWLPSRRNDTLFEAIGLSLPSVFEDEGYVYMDKKRRVVFFLDVSGSCEKYAKRFVQAIRTVDRRLFDITLYYFNEEARKKSLDCNDIEVGGGTSFSCIEKALCRDFEEYPDAVFIITDGFGDDVSPKIPERWHWFLTESSTQDWIPKESKIYKLKDYE